MTNKNNTNKILFNSFWKNRFNSDLNELNEWMKKVWQPNYNYLLNQWQWMFLSLLASLYIYSYWACLFIFWLNFFFLKKKIFRPLKILGNKHQTNINEIWKKRIAIDCIKKRKQNKTTTTTTTTKNLPRIMNSFFLVGWLVGWFCSIFSFHSLQYRYVFVMQKGKFFFSFLVGWLYAGFHQNMIFKYWIKKKKKNKHCPFPYYYSNFFLWKKMRILFCFVSWHETYTVSWFFCWSFCLPTKRMQRIFFQVFLNDSIDHLIMDFRMLK